MPANLTPQYKEAEQRYKRAKGLSSKIAILQEMIGVIPKHKGTDHMRAALRARMSRHLEELEKPRATSSSGPQPFNVRKEGAGQAVMVGLSTSGKSELLNSLTGAPVKVGEYLFTTQFPAIGMLPFENILIQLIDTPALNYKDIQGRLFGLIRTADLLIVLLDLSRDSSQDMSDILNTLKEWGYALLEKRQKPQLDNPSFQKRSIIVANKCDSGGANKAFTKLQSTYGNSYDIIRVSCLTGTGLDILPKHIFQSLDKVRVYTKSPGSQAEYTSPIVIPLGSNVSDAGESLHREWRTTLKYALLWGSSKFNGQRVGRDYVLEDGDTVELHD